MGRAIIARRSGCVKAGRLSRRNTEVMATILLVDDDVMLLERLATSLGEAGYTVLRANRVQNAEMLIVEQRPDVIVLDPDIGSGDGWVLLGVAPPIAPV